MNDQPRVRMRDGFTHLQKQREAIGQACGMRVAPAVDAFAVDILQCQPGLPGRRDAGVVQPSDVRMLQRGEDRALAGEALHQTGTPPRAVRQLQRHAALLGPIDALGQPHRGHAAFAELTQQPVRPDLLAAAVGIGTQRREVAGLDFRQRVQQLTVTGRRIGVRQQRFQARRERGVFGRQRREPGTAPR